MAPVQITHTFVTVHHPQNYPTQPSSNQGFMQWTLPSSVADHPDEGGACLVLMLEGKLRCMNVQEEIQEQSVNSLRFLFYFIFCTSIECAIFQCI